MFCFYFELQNGHCLLDFYSKVKFLLRKDWIAFQSIANTGIIFVGFKCEVC